MLVGIKKLNTYKIHINTAQQQQQQLKPNFLNILVMTFGIWKRL